MASTTFVNGVTLTDASWFNDVNSITYNTTGSGNTVLATSPTLVTPVLGAATATSINKVAITAPATSATITVADGKTLTASNSITLAGTDSTTMTFPSTNATIARTDSAQTFTGVQSMTSPAITTSITTPSTTFALVNTTATTVNAFGAATTLNIGNSGGTNTILGATTFSQAVTHSSTTTLSGALTYGGVTLSNAVTGTGNMVLSASPTLTGTLTAAAITASGQILANGAATTGTAFGVISKTPGVFKSANAGGSVGISVGADASDYGSVGYNLDFQTTAGIKFLASDYASRMFFNGNTLTFQSSTVSGTAGNTISWNTHGTWSPTSLAVTGALTTTNDITYTLSQNATDSIKVVNANAGASAIAEMRVSNNTTSLFMAAGGTSYSGALLTSGVAGYHALSTFGAVGLSIGTNLTSAININSSQAVSMTNGLAVTGTGTYTSTLGITTNNTAFQLKDSGGTMRTALIWDGSDQCKIGDVNNAVANSIAYIYGNASVRAYINNSLILNTTSTGVAVTGTLYTTAAPTAATSGANTTWYNNTGDYAAVYVRHDRASGATSASMIRFAESTNTVVGSITSNGTATAFNTSSDRRLKNITGNLTNSGEFIDALQPRVGTWKADGSPFVGFVADEVQKVSPRSVVGEPNAVDEEGNPVYQAMEYGSAEFIANIIAELKSVRTRLAALEAR